MTRQYRNEILFLQKTRITVSWRVRSATYRQGPNFQRSNFNPKAPQSILGVFLLSFNDVEVFRAEGQDEECCERPNVEFTNSLQANRTFINVSLDK